MPYFLQCANRVRSSTVAVRAPRCVTADAKVASITSVHHCSSPGASQAKLTVKPQHRYLMLARRSHKLTAHRFLLSCFNVNHTLKQQQRTDWQGCKDASPADLGHHCPFVKGKFLLKVEPMDVKFESKGKFRFRTENSLKTYRLHRVREIFRSSFWWNSETTPQRLCQTELWIVRRKICRQQSCPDVCALSI